MRLNATHGRFFVFPCCWAEGVQAMFDWDKDCDDVLQDSRVAPHARPAPKSQAEQIAALDSALLRKWFGNARMLVLGLGLVVATIFPQPVTDASGVAVGSVGMAMLSDLAQEGQDAQMPDLEVYDSARYRRFVAGLRGFEDSQLAQYARATAHDLERAAAFLHPSLRDALRITKAEMSRRGMPIPAEIADATGPRGILANCGARMAGIIALHDRAVHC